MRDKKRADRGTSRGQAARRIAASFKRAMRKLGVSSGFSLRRMNEENDILRGLIGEAKENGLEFKVKLVRASKPKETMDDSVLVRAKYHLMLGPVVVARWSSLYAGSCGCSFASWWVENVDSDRPSLVGSLLEELGIEEPRPRVPRS
jgi:hypothetical protein